VVCEVWGVWNKEEEGEGEERGRNWRMKKRTGIPRG